MQHSILKERWAKCKICSIKIILKVVQIFISCKVLYLCIQPYVIRSTKALRAFEV